MRLVIAILVIQMLFSCNVLKENEEIEVNFKKVKKSDLGETVYYSSKLNSRDTILSQLNNLSYDTIVIKTYHHFPEQLHFQQFKNLQMDSFLFNGAIEYYSIDTSVLSCNPEFDAETIFLVGKRDNDCIIIPDYNNNNQLNDDKPIILKDWFHSTGNEKNRNPKRIRVTNLHGFYKGKDFYFSQGFAIEPLCRRIVLPSGEEKILELSIKLSFDEYYYGKFRMNGHSYKVGVKNYFSSGSLNEKTTFLAFARKGELFEYSKIYDISALRKVRDTVKIGKNYYLISELYPIKKRLRLKKLAITGNDFLDNHFSDFQFTDLLSQDSISTHQILLKSKYLFLDFWGSWCKPCVEGMPELIELKKSLYTQGVSFLSIVYDASENLGKVKEIIKQNKIDWPQSFISRDMEYSIIQKYNVQSFPYFMLVNEKHKILFRDTGKQGLDRLINYLKKLELE